MAFYEEHAERYAHQTEQADLSQLYARFLQFVPPGGRILDIGCGGGRDLHAFKIAGFDCVGLDPSPNLARLAAATADCEVMVGRAQDLNFVNEFDGIWSCASLLHLDRSELSPTLTLVRRALKENGVFLLSMQKGHDSFVASDGRYYVQYSETQLSFVVESAGLDIISNWPTTDTLPGRQAITWTNILARKPK
ncbi:methyltransferase domain-containing protein [Pseudorhodoferax sp. LjRoot39]|uniref:class I SAM-dependent DNA methyltransferase n=1 Tax=Pseudorhodoferax sp. LjRoot39 TaxID=3342328 RepID=UPI003ED13F1E